VGDRFPVGYRSARLGHMKTVAASELTARCLALFDRIHDRIVTVVPISAAIAAKSIDDAPVLRDPARRLIVATSRALKLPVLTRSKAIIRPRLAK
jgi:PIN domain nuclease of toxin-antitoxin system